MSRLKIFFGGLICLFLLLGKESAAVSSQRRLIQYGFSVENTSSFLQSHIELSVFAPVDESGRQRCLSLKASRPFRIQKDSLGNQFLCFFLDSLPPFSTVLISVRCELEFPEEGEELGKEIFQNYLSAEPFTESENSEIVFLSSEWRKSSDSAEAVFKWVSSNILYEGYRSGMKSALETLKTKKGDCTEYALLSVALCRALKIPARMVSGVVIMGEGLCRLSDYHDWAEFGKDNKWHILDAQKKRFNTRLSDNVIFKIYPSGVILDLDFFKKYSVNCKSVKINFS